MLLSNLVHHNIIIDLHTILPCIWRGEFEILSYHSQVEVVYSLSQDDVNEENADDTCTTYSFLNSDPWGP